MKKTIASELNIIFPNYLQQKVKRIANSNLFKMPDQNKLKM